MGKYFFWYKSERSLEHNTNIGIYKESQKTKNPPDYGEISDFFKKELSREIIGSIICWWWLNHSIRRDFNRRFFHIENISSFSFLVLKYRYDTGAWRILSYNWHHKFRKCNCHRSICSWSLRCSSKGCKWCFRHKEMYVIIIAYISLEANYSSLPSSITTSVFPFLGEKSSHFLLFRTSFSISLRSLSFPFRNVRALSRPCPSFVSP